MSNPKREIDPAELRHILILRPDNRLGNLILLTPFLETLRSTAPHARITLIAGRQFTSILEGDDRVDEILHPEDGMRTLATLRRTKWDVAYETHFPGATSFSGSLLLAWSHAERRIGYDHPRSRPGLTESISTAGNSSHAVRELLDLSLSIRGCTPRVKPPSLKLKPGEPSIIDSLHRRMREKAGHRRILIHTGGRGLKGWSLSAFRDLGTRLASSGFDIWVAQGPGAPAWPDPARESLFYFLPPMPVNELGHCLTMIDRFIGCDSGVMHLAASVGTPVTGIFRSSDPRRYAPVGSNHQVLVLGNNSQGYLNRTSWPSLPPELAPRLDIPQNTLLTAEPSAQVDWALEQILDTSLGSRGQNEVGRLPENRTIGETREGPIDEE